MSKINIEKLESTEVMTPFSFMFGGKASFSIVVTLLGREMAVR